ncbi:Acetolactate synthase 2, chloroplastic [Senna tora]|uniref:Acetolactate synthase n=1 Tax=Senna tora TaxID=362788 RepID=A0A834SU44_9FABA|nr:Acetolactate synthase 2, chloroplastic [Senna tora]
MNRNWQTKKIQRIPLLRSRLLLCFSAKPEMAAIAPKHIFSSSLSSSSSYSSSPSSLTNQITKFTVPFSSIPKKSAPPCVIRISNSGPGSPTPASSVSALSTTTTTGAASEAFVSRFAPDEPRKGADILVEALERHGVTNVFAYPGGASMEIHQALTRSNTIRNVLPRHEQGGVFAAEGYARSSGLPGVCIATSGPGATNLVSGLADALLDSVPLIAITGQVPRRMIGTDAFQETPIVEVTRSITKHNYLVLDVNDIPRVVSEAFFLATSGRPGPVLIDIPKDIQQQPAIPNWDQPIKLPGYMSRIPKSPDKAQLEQIVRLIMESKKPVLYVGGGCLNSSEELRQFVELTGLPVASTLMGLGAYPTADEYSLQMLGMHGTVYANYAVDKSDLLLAFGVRFDDRVTGKLDAFASRAKIIHIDIDSAEIGKNKQPHVSVCADLKLALKGINQILESKGIKDKLDFGPWRVELNEQKLKFPMSYKTFEKDISPQYAIQVLDELTNGNAIISTGVGQHQMWAAQFYKYKRPRQWLTSGGLGAMGFGLPAAIGAAVANPNTLVVDIDGDGSFMMNVQELATIKVENLPIKIMLLNNQHLGMVVQWEDRFYKSNRAHTYLGDPSKETQIFPNMLDFAAACGIPAARVTKKDDLRAAIQKMLDTPGPYLLDVIVPHQEHVLPMIPSNGTFNDVITEVQYYSANNMIVAISIQYYFANSIIGAILWVQVQQSHSRVISCISGLNC